MTSTFFTPQGKVCSPSRFSRAEIRLLWCEVFITDSYLPVKPITETTQPSARSAAHVASHSIFPTPGKAGLPHFP